ncbi:hypothetical protein BC830DRAFT_1159087 [Chytriomyces sp. MP71]|nr:hypothetical protein BC830DRAFT_1159087 [Chytriomyces sp. MP71]
MGNLHGGATATIIDETTSVVHTALDHVAMHVSTDLSVTYVSAAKVGETVLIECTGKAAGKTLLFSEASLFIKKEDGSRGRLVAYGKHTKFVMQPRL